MSFDAPTIENGETSAHFTPGKPKAAPAGDSALSRWSARCFRSFLLPAFCWAAGRGYELTTGQAFFPPMAVQGVTLAGLGLFGLYLVLRLAGVVAGAKYLARFKLLMTWLAVGSVCAGLAWFFPSFRIAADGLGAALAGLDDAAGQAIYLLFKFIPAAPALPLVLGSGIALGANIPIGAIVPFLFPGEVYATYGWVSLGLAVALFFLPSGKGFFKIIHLLAAFVFTLFFSGLITSVLPYLPGGEYTNELARWAQHNLPVKAPDMPAAVVMHGGLVLAGVLQVLLVVAVLRSWALRKTDDLPRALTPPGAVRLFLLINLVLLIVADMFNRLMLVLGSV